MTKARMAIITIPTGTPKPANRSTRIKNCTQIRVLLKNDREVFFPKRKIEHKSDDRLTQEFNRFNQEMTEQIIEELSKILQQAVKKNTLSLMQRYFILVVGLYIPSVQSVLKSLLDNLATTTPLSRASNTNEAFEKSLIISNEKKLGLLAQFMLLTVPEKVELPDAIKKKNLFQSGKVIPQLIASAPPLFHAIYANDAAVAAWEKQFIAEKKKRAQSQGPSEQIKKIVIAPQQKASEPPEEKTSTGCFAAIWRCLAKLFTACIACFCSNKNKESDVIHEAQAPTEVKRSASAVSHSGDGRGSSTYRHHLGAVGSSKTQFDTSVDTANTSSDLESNTVYHPPVESKRNTASYARRSLSSR